MRRGRPRSRRVVAWAEAEASYASYMETHRGLSATHRFHVMWSLSKFIAFAREHGAEAPSNCTLQTVDAWAAELAERELARHTLNSRLSAVRRFLGFLHAEGHLPEDLSLHVEGPRIHRESSVPDHLPWPQMMQLLQSVSPDRRSGLRDRAIVALMMTTGLRASEVAALTLDDIDWRQASLVVRCRKNRRPLQLPLLPEVVEALTVYLRQERTAGCPYRELFLSRYQRPFVSGAAISQLLRRLIAAAGLGTRCAAHALRRGLGTHLLERGAGPAQIALILGHESLLSTRQYLRLSMEQLREVADNYAELL